MVDYNIEFAHIYTDEAFSPEHAEGISVLKKVLAGLPSGTKVTTSVLIDDYNPTKNLLVVSDFTRQLSEAGVTPDFIAWESVLTKQGYSLLNSIHDDRVYKTYENYIRSHGKFPCSYLIAVWNLIRLGYLTLPDNLFCCANKPVGSFTATNIYSVLPDRFAEVEKKALDIIKATSYADALKQVQHIYFPSPECLFKLSTKKDIF